MKTHRRIGMLIAAALAAAVVACGSPPPATGDQPPSAQASQLVTDAQFNTGAAWLLRSVTLTRVTFTELFKAGKVTAEQDVLVGRQLDLLVEGARTARSLRARDVQSAAAQLAAAIAGYQTLRQQSLDSASLPALPK